MMAWGLIIIWIFVFGYVMYKYRDFFKSIFEKIPGKWSTKFLFFVILLALIEEAITTALTNMAPLFGSTSDQAFITGSTNFFQVIFHHSVIVFLPFFVGWTWLLKRYNFSANQTFWLFGITGAFVEAMSFGGIGEFGLWIFVYGLMIYLPTYCIPQERGANNVRVWHYPLVIIVPVFFFLIMFFIVFLWKSIGLPAIPNFGPDLISK